MTEPSNELVHILSEALQATLDSDSPANYMTQMSIRTGIVRDDPVLIDLYDRMVGPFQAEVDLHLDGAGVIGNSTNAHNFSQFISGISEAVKETAKSRAGKGRYSESLLIEGVLPGSVRVVLRAPDPPNTKQDTPLDSSAALSTVDSDALRSIVAILSHASSEDDDSPMIAELSDLPPLARRGLMRAAKTSEGAGWDIKGRIRQRNVGSSDVALTHAGAYRLRLGLNSQVTKRTEETEVGSIDGFRRSLSTLYFQPDRGGRIIQAAVPDNVIAATIAELAADQDSLVEAVFEVVESYLPGDESRPQRSRSVRRIRGLDLGRQLAMPADD